MVPADAIDNSTEYREEIPERNSIPVNVLV
jgi:hypothetical protein